MRTNFNGSQLYEAKSHVNVTYYRTFRLEETKILVGAYIGTLVPTFFIVAFTAGTVLTHTTNCIFLRSPPGGTWELLQALRRDHGDRFLAGPPGNVAKIEEKSGSYDENHGKNLELVNLEGCGVNLLEPDSAPVMVLLINNCEFIGNFSCTNLIVKFDFPICNVILCVTVE